MPKVAFTTLGCRLNQAESDSMAEQLLSRGFEAAATAEEADLVVVNTCTVTREATKASRSAIRRAVRARPGARVAVIGCYAVSDPEEVRAIPGVDAVLGNTEKDDLPRSLAGCQGLAPLLQVGPIGERPPAVSSRVRANLKVQTGCDEWCSFCIIPRTRGPLASRPLEQVLSEAHRLVQAGARELVLTGVHLGKYGYDRGEDERSLLRLLRGLLDIEELQRIRLSSILSRHLTDEVIDLLAQEPRVCSYLHDPLQSVDDGVLAAMHRPYRIEGYVERVARARSRIPGLALATDVIVGFPGESDAAFRRTVEVVEELGFVKLHVFRYSARPSTPAAAMAHKELPVEIKRERSRNLIDRGNAIRRRFLHDHVGRPLEVLVEDERVVDGASICSGQTSDHVRVWFEGRHLLGSMVEVRGERVRADGIEGRLAAAAASEGSA